MARTIIVIETTTRTVEYSEEAYNDILHYGTTSLNYAEILQELTQHEKNAESAIIRAFSAFHHGRAGITSKLHVDYTIGLKDNE